MLDSAAAASGQLPPDVAERLTTVASRTFVERQSYAIETSSWVSLRDMQLVLRFHRAPVLAAGPTQP